MRRMFLMSSVLLTVPFYAGTAGAEVCIAEEDCNNLGYTEDKSCTDGLKCPFGEKWHCPDKKCQIGWILNSDMSCTENVESGKTPIAVVVYLGDNGNGQAMTASPINSSSLTWSSTAMAKTDIPSLPNIMQNQFATDINSCQNSFYIAAYGDSSKFPAVWAAKNYTPAAAPNTKWKWCLPSAGILRSVIDNKEVINKAIDLLGGRKIEETSSKSEGILSSSEADGTWIWETCYSRDLCTSYKDYTNGNFLYSVRPVIEFNIDTGAAECKKLPDETGCANGTESGDDGCGGTRKVCKTECTYEGKVITSDKYYRCSCRAYYKDQTKYQWDQNYSQNCRLADGRSFYYGTRVISSYDWQGGYKVYNSKAECFDDGCIYGESNSNYSMVETSSKCTVTTTCQ